MTQKILILFIVSGALCWGQSASISPVPSRDTDSCPVGTTNSAPPDQPVQCSPAPTPAALPKAFPPSHEADQAPVTEPSTMPTTPEPPVVTAPKPSSQLVRPLTVQSEFEQYANNAAGHPLPVYGRQLFNQVPNTFAPMNEIPVPANYVLGPGDQLLIRVWGKIDLDTKVTVDRSGQIFLPKVGSLSVAGLRYEQIEEYVRAAIANLYKGFELNVTMGQLRSIQIFVLGSARQPGVYTVSSLSTLVDALFASGGPSATGSMRHIQLRRGGELVTELDLYDLLRNGDQSKDAHLLPGDVIFLPPIGPQIAVIGSINEPGIYEMKGETTLSAALKCAGGLTNLAGNERVLLERIEDRRRRQVDDFPLDSASMERVLNDGDILEIFPVSLRFDNAVTLRGNVAQPGRFPWHDGMRVSDLIPSRDFLITRGYWKQQDNLGRNAHVDIMTDLAQNSAEINWDYASIERLDDHDLSTRLVAFNLGNALTNPASSDNALLRPGDIITVFSRGDLQLPEDKRASFVRVSGEVNAPGVYRIAPGETLREVVERAGGLTPHSYLYASQLTRMSTRLAEEEQLRLAINQMQRELLSRYAAAPALNSTSAPEQQSRLGAQQSVIAQLSSVHPTGRIVLDMKSGANALADIPNFPLEDGDTFNIPARLSTIQVSGAVYNENAFRYQPRKRLAAYLKDAGGPTRQADAKRMFLIRADGTVVSRQSGGMLWRDSFESLNLLPGDAIYVPTKLKSPTNFMQQLPFVTQMLSQTALTGAVLGTAY